MPMTLQRRVPSESFFFSLISHHFPQFAIVRELSSSPRNSDATGSAVTWPLPMRVKRGGFRIPNKSLLDAPRRRTPSTNIFFGSQPHT